MLRSLFITLWLAAYTAITLCGPSLHELTGGAHGRVPACGRSDEGVRAQADPRSPSVSETTLATADDETHCPICFFLAQAQVVPEVVSASVAQRVDLAPRDESAVDPPSHPCLRSRPRAPPRPASAPV